jgi:hypothetical protein
MSGGHFDYNQFRINDIATELKNIIDNNQNSDLDEYGCQIGTFYNSITINELNFAHKILQLASIYTHRIDYLVSGDDGEDTFHKRLKDDLQNIDLSNFCDQIKKHEVDN